LNGRWRGSTVCLYTNTPDEDFIIDAHPAHPQVLIVSPCSGHGFKFSSAIGEIVTDLVTEGESALDLTPFRLARFGSRSAVDSPAKLRLEPKSDTSGDAAPLR
jgi:glycine/D-amino acid oxidase-like deaminating enzyme